jgi:hypothetical protein
MTSPLRRKRRITPLSSRRRDERSVVRGQGAGAQAYRLRFSSIAALLILATVTSTVHSGEVKKLQWGGDRAAAAKESKTRSALRFVKPSTGSSSHVDAEIRLAAFEESEAPRLTSGRDEGDATRSVVVNRSGDGDSSNDGFRSAQLPAGSSDTSTNPSGKVEDGLRSPFIDNPEEPQQTDAPQFSTPTVPENNTANPSTEPNPYAQPGTSSDPGSPASPLSGALGAERTPATTPGAAGQFQPVLPSGPGPDQSPPTQNTQRTEAMIQAEGEKAQESCEKSLENLRAFTVDKVKLDIAIVGTEGEDYPFECSIDDGSMHAGRCWEQITFMWKASALCHKPLYFEDEQLERYGHSWSPCCQTLVSGAHFFTRPFVLPYCMGVEPPCECIYALGHYRPGSCAPYMCNPVPLSPRGALFQAGAVVGTAAAIP